MKNSNKLINVLVPVVSVLLAFVIGCAVMAFLGANPLTALQSLWTGAFGNLRNVGTTLSRATPLIFTGLCACFAYRCGVFNLGGEGQFIIGSVACCYVATQSGIEGFPATYRELAKHPNIVAVKEACGNISQIAQTMQLCGDELDLYSGNDDQIVPLLSLGGKGVISVLSNVAPRQTHEICQLFFDGKVAESRQLQLQLLPLINALFSDVNPIPVKEAMNLLGWHCGECRLPLTTMQPQAREQLAQCLQQAGLIA